MVSITIMVGMAVLNAATFIGGNCLARMLSCGSDQAALDQKKHHNKALEAYQVAYNKFSRERTELLNWIERNKEVVAQANQNLTNTDYALKLYNQLHSQRPTAPLKEPKFCDFYQLSDLQKKGELCFLGAGTAALGYAMFCFL